MSNVQMFIVDLFLVVGSCRHVCLCMVCIFFWMHIYIYVEMYSYIFLSVLKNLYTCGCLWMNVVLLFKSDSLFSWYLCFVWKTVTKSALLVYLASLNKVLTSRCLPGIKIIVYWPSSSEWMSLTDQILTTKASGSGWSKHFRPGVNGIRPVQWSFNADDWFIWRPGMSRWSIMGDATQCFSAFMGVSRF